MNLFLFSIGKKISIIKYIKKQTVFSFRFIIYIALKEEYETIKIRKMNNRVHDLKSKIEKADKGHYYLSVLRKGDDFKTAQVKLRGAIRMFDKDRDFIYVRPLRLAGHRSEIHAFLSSSGFDDKQIKTYLDDAYTNSNFEKMYSEYEKEIAKIPSAVRKTRTTSINQIVSLKKSLEGFKLESKNSVRSPVPGTPKLSAAGGKADLKTRLSLLRDDKVMEITSFDSIKKNGIKTINKPIKGTKQAVGNTQDLKRIYYDFAKPIENGVAALVHLGFSQEKATKIMKDPSHTKSDLSSIALKH